VPYVHAQFVPEKLYESWTTDLHCFSIHKSPYLWATNKTVAANNYVPFMH